MISTSQKPLPDNIQHSQQTNTHTPVGFEPTISAGERPQTYALDRAATGPALIAVVTINCHVNLCGLTVAVVSAPCFTARRCIKAIRHKNICAECPSAGANELDRSPHVLLSTLSSHSNLTTLTVTSHSSSVTSHSLRKNGTIKTLFVNVRLCCMIHGFEVS